MSPVFRFLVTRKSRVRNSILCNHFTGLLRVLIFLSLSWVWQDMNESARTTTKRTLDRRGLRKNDRDTLHDKFYGTYLNQYSVLPGTEVLAERTSRKSILAWVEAGHVVVIKIHTKKQNQRQPTEARTVTIRKSRLSHTITWPCLLPSTTTTMISSPKCHKWDQY